LENVGAFCAASAVACSVGAKAFAYKLERERSSPLKRKQGQLRSCIRAGEVRAAERDGDA